MTLKEEIAKSRKLNSALRMQLEDLAEDTDPDQLLFDVIMSLTDDRPFTAAGVEIHSRTSKILTAKASLNGLKNLVDDPLVRRVEGPIEHHFETPVRPQPPKGPK